MQGRAKWGSDLCNAPVSAGPTPRLGVWPGFESRYRSLSGGSVRCAFYAHPGTPRLGFYRYGLKDHSAYACGSPFWPAWA